MTRYRGVDAQCSGSVSGSAIRITIFARGAVRGTLECSRVVTRGVEATHDEIIRIERTIDAAPATRCHCSGVENGCSIAVFEECMKAIDNGLQKAVDAIGPGYLKQRAEDLWGAERRARRRQATRVEIVKKSLDGEIGVWKIETAWA